MESFINLPSDLFFTCTCVLQIRAMDVIWKYIHVYMQLSPNLYIHVTWEKFWEQNQPKVHNIQHIIGPKPIPIPIQIQRIHRKQTDEDRQGKKRNTEKENERVN